MDYGSLIWVTLQRAKNADEAITIMDQLCQTYGYRVMVLALPPHVCRDRSSRSRTHARTHARTRTCGTAAGTPLGQRSLTPSFAPAPPCAAPPCGRLPHARPRLSAL